MQAWALKDGVLFHFLFMPLLHKIAGKLAYKLWSAQCI